MGVAQNKSAPFGIKGSWDQISPGTDILSFLKLYHLVLLSLNRPIAEVQILLILPQKMACYET